MSSITRPGQTLSNNANGGPAQTSTYSAFEDGFPDLPPVLEGAVHKVESYGREKPLQLAMIAVGIGFVLGWKLKPW